MTKTIAFLAALIFAAPLAAQALPQANEFKDSYPTSTINDPQSQTQQQIRANTPAAQRQNGN
jgi:hypothetical protein